MVRPGWLGSATTGESIVMEFHRWRKWSDQVVVVVVMIPCGQHVRDEFGKEDTVGTVGR